MKRNQEYYRAIVVFSCESCNRFRAYESNTFDDTDEMFEKMFAELQKRANKDWTLTFEKHLSKNHIQIIKFRSASESADSPLF